MSVGGHSRNYSGSVGSRSSYRSRTTSNPPPTSRSNDEDGSQLQPCASTSSMLLYAEGRTIYCLNHGTLAIERKFEKHKEKVTMLSVDNVSETGQGRLAVSYDLEMTAIVWDIWSGEEIARFASFERLTAASWMKNGNIAFGDALGHVLVFEPATSEHHSMRTIFDPVTALAPAADCQTYAIGYKNGSVLIASLQPGFTILHTLSTSRAPSPVVGLAWHASSSKQRSDMLAIQIADGDLRVWSVAKAPNPEAPKVIRVLKRGDNVEAGRNWIAWSKNGRILQYAQGETWAWDVRTKHVAYEQIPTVENVRGLANHGPNAALFTLGPDGTVQQYDVSSASLVRNVRPEYVERPSAQNTPKINPRNIIGAAPPQPIYNVMDGRNGPQSLATIQEATSQAAIEHARQMREDVTSPVSTSSRAESVSSRSSAGGGRGGDGGGGGGSRQRDRAPSVASSRAPSGTIFSALSTPMIARDSVASPFWASASVASSSRRSRGSRLKHEVLRSPEPSSVDLFPFTRQRLAKLPYAPQQQSLDPEQATSGELRRQMLAMVFGWEGDIEDMIRNEMQQHPPSSTNAALLGKWLGESNMNPMGMMASENISQTDWMLLALSNMSGAGEAGKQMGRAFAQKLIAQGDIHTAATIHLGIQDSEEAVDVYVSRNYFMEGILLTTLLFPEDWERQSHLVRRWGEYVVENSQQHLAIRCFTCTGADNSVPWASPTHSPFATNGKPSQQNMPNISTMISPPVSPPGVVSPSKAQMMTANNPGLRLITSFSGAGAEKPHYKFPGLKTDDGTPTAAPGITPIADSALSPGGTPGGARLGQGRSSKRSTSHVRLASIGETPIETNAPELGIPNTVKRLPTPETSGSDRENQLQKGKKREEEREREREKEKDRERNLPALSLQTQDLDKKVPSDDVLPLLSATVYNPHEQATPKPQATPQTAMPTTATKLSHSEMHALALARAKEGSRHRNGSRDRKPSGLQITMPSLDQVNLPQLTGGTDKSASQSHLRKGSSASSSQHSSSTTSGKFASRDIDNGDLPSAPLTGRSWASSMKSPSVSGRSIDQYISSLEEANFYAKKKKEALRAARSRERRSSQSRTRAGRDETSERDRDARGRGSQRFIQAPKRSPSSPVSMSHEDLKQYRQSAAASVTTTDYSTSALPTPALSTPGLSTPGFQMESGTEEPQQQNQERQRAISRRRTPSRIRSQSKVSEMSHRTVREVSPDGGRTRQQQQQQQQQQQRKSSRMGRRSRGNSRAASPDRLLSPIERGRSKSKGDGSLARSPSSPLPFSPQAALYRESSTDRQPDPMRLVEANQQRLRSRQRSRARSTSRRPNERGSSRARREPSQDGRSFHVSHASEPNVLESFEKRTSDSQSDGSNNNDNSYMARHKSMRSIKREAAQRELEARRESLILHSQQSIAHPSELSRPPMPDRTISDQTSNGAARRTMWSPPDEVLREGAPNPFERSASAAPLLGLPATPRAMKHPKYQGREDIPAVPAIPAMPDQMYATGQPVFEPARAASAPIPEPENGRNESGVHPAYRQTIRPSNAKRANQFAPLHEIGRSRQGSVDAGVNQHMGSIDEALHPIIEGEGENAVIVVPEYHGPSTSTPTPSPPPNILPQLAHLYSGGANVNSNNNDIPPPPPPPPKAPGSTVVSPASNGSFSIFHADEASNNGFTLPAASYTPSPISKPNSPPAWGQQAGGMSPPARSPPPSMAAIADPMDSARLGARSPPSSGHRRGRSIDGVGSKISRFAERMRSSSRGRNDSIMREREKKTKSPKPLTEGFGEGIRGGLPEGGRAPYETASYF